MTEYFSFFKNSGLIITNLIKHTRVCYLPVIRDGKILEMKLSAKKYIFMKYEILFDNYSPGNLLYRRYHNLCSFQAYRLSGLPVYQSNTYQMSLHARLQPLKACQFRYR